MWAGEEYTLRDIQSGIDRMFKKDTKNTGLFLPLLEIFKEHRMYNFSRLLPWNYASQFATGSSPWGKTCYLEVQVCNWCVCPAVAYYDAAISVAENFPSLADPVLQIDFAFDFFGPTVKQWNSFLILSGKNQILVMHMGTKRAPGSRHELFRKLRGKHSYYFCSVEGLPLFDSILLSFNCMCPR